MNFDSINKGKDFINRKPTPRQVQEALELNNSKMNTESKTLDISSLKEGEIIKGSVIDLWFNEVKLLVEPEGKILIAHLSEDVPLSIGQDAQLIVAKDFSGQFILRHKSDDSQSLIQQISEKALSASNLPISEENVSIVKELLNHQLPINKDTLQTLHKFAIRHPEAKTSTLVSMYKNEIPITTKNIEQFDSYQQESHQLLNVIHKIEENISQTIDNISQNVVFTEQLLTILKSNPTYTNQDSLPISDILSQEQTQALANYLDPFSLGENQLESIREGSANLTELLDIYTEILSEYHSDYQNENVVLEQDKLAQNPVLPQDLHSLFRSTEYSETIRQAFHIRWTIPLKNLPKEKTVSNLYRILEEDMELLSKIESASSKAIDDSINSIMKEETKNVQDNMNFMKDLNQLIQYIQLPVFLKDRDLHVDLYVLSKKKALLDKKDSFTVIIDLDMEHLGPINIKLIMSDKNIQADFLLVDPESAKLIEEELDQVKASLAKKGYSFNGKVDLRKEKSMVFDEILNQNVNKEGSFRYSFDIRA